MKRSLAMTSLIVGVVSLALMPAAAQQDDARLNRAPDRAKFHRKGALAIPSNYIVVLKDDADADDFFVTAAKADDLIRMGRGVGGHLYTAALRGFSAEMTEQDALALSEDPRVAYVEEDQIMTTQVTQSNPPSWGLDRVDQRNRPLSASYTYVSTGAVVNAYVIDTGIRRTHQQFGGRAFVGFDAINDGRNSNDCNGHGTHVAGTIGGSTVGLAKAVRLFAVRVLSCTGSGSNAGVIAGVNWVTQNRIRPAVANMSLGGGVSTALDTAVNNSINAGVVYAVAAGNSNTNAANSSPARVAAAITVGSSTINDARSSFSNFGSVVDIFAPGSSITSAWITSDTTLRSISGTSMASPHVAGIVARYLQTNQTASAATARNAIVADATLNVLTGIPAGTANRLLFRAPTQ